MKINYEVKDGKRYGVITYNNTTEYEKAAKIIEAIEDYGYWVDITEFRDASDERTWEGLAEARFDVGDKEEYNKVVDVYNKAKYTCENTQKTKNIANKNPSKSTHHYEDDCLLDGLQRISNVKS